MKSPSLIRFVLSAIAAAIFIGCTEPYALQTSSFEDALVIEATITNELKPQVIKVSHTYRLEEDGPTMETGATVTVQDDLGNVYDFNEQDDSYVSEPFQGVAGRIYTLHIITSDGSEYVSTPERLPTATALDEITTSIVTQDGVEGVQFEANAYDPSGMSKYYRYEYEETYKVTAPLWSPLKIVVVDNPASTFDNFVVLPREEETRVCYGSGRFTTIILAGTNDLSEDRITKFPVHFLGSQDSRLRERYSILIRQYVHNLASYTYYTTLKAIAGGTGSILSQNQPGFFYGNIKSVGRPDEKVIGFFDVSFMTEKRVFFNYTDLFSTAVPPFPYDCPIVEYDASILEGTECYRGYCGLHGNVEDGAYVHYNSIPPIFFVVPAVCGDCRESGSNIRPAFWED